MSVHYGFMKGGRSGLEELHFDELMENESVRGEFERRLGQALEEARGGWEQDLERRLISARAEGERIAGMSAEERLKERERQLAEREREITRRELRAMAAQLLAGRGLPGELADALCFEDAEACERSIDSVERAFRAAVQQGITQRLGSGTPPRGGEICEPAKLTDDQYYAARMQDTKRAW